MGRKKGSLNRRTLEEMAQGVDPRITPRKSASTRALMEQQVERDLLMRSHLGSRSAFAMLVDLNFHRLQGWIDKIEREDGAKEAFKCFMQLAEYHSPKLSRADVKAEVSGPGGGPMEWTVKFVGGTLVPSDGSK